MTQEKKIWHTPDEVPQNLEKLTDGLPDVVFQHIGGQYLGGVWDGYDFITVFDEEYPPTEIKRWAYIKDLVATADAVAGIAK